MAKYLDRFDSIRRLQEFLVSRAVATGTPVIENENAELATRAVAELVLSTAERA
jgi:2-phosphoglycerate kinase